MSRARIVFFGALRVLADGVDKTIRRGLLLAQRCASGGYPNRWQFSVTNPHA